MGNPALRAASLAALLITGSRAEAACTVGAVGVAFGAYGSLVPLPDDGVGTVSADCHPSDQSPVVAISTGLSGSFSPRRMQSGVAGLDYNLYTTVGRTIVWGDGSAGTATVTLTGGSVSAGVRRFSRAIYGRIPAGQPASSGIYADTLVVTIIF